MQTFLPYPGFRRSAEVLDDRRLGKQRVETFQILRALTWPRYAWKNHPAVVMWRGFVPALVAYGLATCDEWEARGRADATRSSLLQFTAGQAPSYEGLRARGQLPPWLGWDPVHVSHQSALVRKDPEHYRAVFPDVPDDLPYLWPGSAFPRWPLRRGTAEGLPLDAALVLLGLEQLPDGAEDVLDAVAEGRDVELPPGSTSHVALVAALVTPGRTAWVAPGGPLPDEPPPPAPRPLPEGQAAGKVSTSIARAPTPEDLAAVRAEATAEPELVFLRPHHLAAGPPDGVGLLVLDGPAEVVPRPPWPVPAVRLCRA